MDSLALVEISDDLTNEILSSNNSGTMEEDHLKNVNDKVIPDGKRNYSLAVFGMFLSKQGMSEKQIYKYLSEMNKDCCRPPLDKNEILKITKGMKRYKAKVDLIELKSWSLGEYMNDPSFQEPIPVVQGLFNLSEFIIISAPAKAGKSILAMNLAISVASGNKFLDHFETIQKKVLYLQTEIGNFQLRQRLELSIPGDYTSFSENFLIANNRIPLDKKSGLEQLENFIIKEKIKVLILDPFYTLHTSKEDSSTEMAPILANIKEIALKYELLIVLVHHQGKRREGEMQTGHKHRGSSSFADVPDGSLSLNRSTDYTASLDCEFRNIESPGNMKLMLENLNWKFDSVIEDKKKLTFIQVKETLSEVKEIGYTEFVDLLKEKYSVSKRKAQEQISYSFNNGQIFKKKKGRNAIYYSDDFDQDLIAEITAKVQMPKDDEFAHMNNQNGES
jgi:hypothetical protein